MKFYRTGLERAICFFGARRGIILALKSGPHGRQLL